MLTILKGTYPFQDKDPFVIKTCSHIFIAGDQPRLESKTIKGPEGQTVRLIAVPSFRRTGILTLLDSETLEVESIKFELFEGGTTSANGVVVVQD
jgi:DNA polymerase delta subunit 2